MTFAKELVDWCYDDWQNGITFALAACKDRANAVPITTYDIPDHANATEGELRTAGERDGVRWISDYVYVPFGRVGPQAFETSRLDRWRVELSEDGQIRVTLLDWGLEPIELEDVEFFEKRDLAGRNGQFARGFLREYNGVTLITMSFDRRKVFRVR